MNEHMFNDTVHKTYRCIHYWSSIKKKEKNHVNTLSNLTLESDLEKSVIS